VKEQLQEATDANKAVTQEMEEKDSLLIKYRAIDKELLRNREENDAQQAKVGPRRVHSLAHHLSAPHNRSKT
jgi:hypothetical protein